MRYHGREIKIFGEEDAGAYFDQKIHALRQIIENEVDDYLLNVNEEDYLNYLIVKFTVEPLEILFENAFISTHEDDIPSECFPNSFLYNVHAGKRYKKDVIRYHISFKGDEALLRCVPNPRIMWTIPVEIEDKSICFNIINFDNDPEDIRRKAEVNIRDIQTQYNYLSAQVSKYNNSLRDEAKSSLNARRQHLLKKYDVLSSLGVPIRKRSEVPKTFTVHAVNKKTPIIVKKPEVYEKGFKPEPTLDEETYNSILQIIHDVGKQFERLPSTYSGKEEEHLRDHILLILEPNFEGSATGETFNKTGKTDILLRYEGKNVFIGECKFWRGEKAYLSTISQLLSYLTWRDSKSSVVIFVRNKEFSSVLSIVKESTSKHPNFLRFVDERDETWINYRFHIEGDRNREVKLAVMLYHLPI